MDVRVLVVILAVLGGLGLYLALPGRTQTWRRFGALALTGAAGVLIALLCGRLADGGRDVWFVILSLIGLIGAVRVITHANPVYSALYFIMVIVSTAGLLLLADAEFVAALLLLVYAGAILVTYLFVIMLARQAKAATYDVRAREPLLGALAGFVLLGLLSAAILSADAPPTAAPVTAAATDAAPPTGDAWQVAVPLMTTYMIGLQITGVLLLAAMVGAIAVARRRPTPEEMEVGL